MNNLETFRYIGTGEQYPVNYMDNTLQPEALDSLTLLVDYIAKSDPETLANWLRRNGVRVNSYDIVSLRQNTLQFLASGDSRQQDEALKGLIALHPDTDLILSIHPKGCTCENCKQPFFNKERLIFLGLIVVLFVGMYFLTRNSE